MGIDRQTKICVRCEVEMRVKTNGVLLVEAATYGFVTARDADLWHCPVCDFEIVSGAAPKERYGNWYVDDMVAQVKKHEAAGQRVVLCWLNDREKQKFLRRGKEAEEKAKVGL